MEYKKPEEKTGQNEYLAIQLSSSKKNRAGELVTVISFLVLIFFFAFFTLLKPADDFSEQENRYLQKFPKIQTDFDGSFVERVTKGKFLDRLFDGKFTSEVSKFYADQLPLRDSLVGLKAYAEIGLGKGENNGVILCSDGYIIKDEEYPDWEKVEENAASILAFADKLSSDGIKVYAAIAPRPEDMLEDYLPGTYPKDETDRTRERFYSLFEGKDSYELINLYDVLKAGVDEAGPGCPDEEQMLYRTDHHWTSFGAWRGYCETVKRMGGEPYPLSAFDPELVSDSFYGTTWSSGGMKFVSPDRMYYLRYEGDEDYTTTITDNGKVFDGFYDREYLAKKDKYSSFISGNNALVKVEKKNGEGREKLLIVKDSYAHSLVPLLARHYDLVIVDTRYYKKSVRALALDEGCDAVLINAYFGTFTSSNIFSMLKYGLDK